LDEETIYLPPDRKEKFVREVLERIKGFKKGTVPFSAYDIDELYDRENEGNLTAKETITFNVKA
jgi:hypothetical protein